MSDNKYADTPKQDVTNQAVTKQVDIGRIGIAAQLAAEREQLAREEPEPSLGSRLGQIGILGWSIVLPALLGVVLGRWLDHHYGEGIFFTAPLLMLGAAFGLWSAWRWMHRQTETARKTGNK